MTSTEFKLDGYSIADKIHDGFRTQVYRGLRCSDRLPVAIKVLKNEYPSISELIRFRNQFTIAQTLDSPGIIRSYGLETLGNRLALVMEDFGGISLTEYAGAQQQSAIASGRPDPSPSLPIIQFFPIAIQLADILHKLYDNCIIHKDIKPANILIHPTTKIVKLIDFSIATLLPKELPVLHASGFLEGTLAYISPEQTGRMNRGIDYRTDFYSLGVTFYQLLTGQLPFSASDPMELLHCHIAKAPTSPHTQHPIPKTLSGIVLKLMAKNAEDRYQSALGLKYDLEKCWQQWHATATIDNFPLGQQDFCDRFTIPEKLYGREYEVAQLLVAFDRISGGNSELRQEVNNQSTSNSPHPPTPSTSELILVAGYSGVGKTAIVNEIHKPIARQQGYFIRGKFDQMGRNSPLSAFVRAFRDLIEQLLAQSRERVEVWKQRILEALGNNAQVIIDAIPELEKLLGPQPAVPQLAGSALQNRFNLLFAQFVSVFTQPDRPLVIFLDDLQWADAASLQLMQRLMEQNVGGLLLVGAYRDNEVSAVHPFMLAVEEIRRSGATVNQIEIEPLKQIDLTRLIADTLKCSPQRAQPLSELVFQKTGGNPFFLRQFLTFLHQEGLIVFVPPDSLPAASEEDRGRWQCNLTRIKELAFTDDVVAFVVGQLYKLPAGTQDALKRAACIGDEFDLATLAIICETDRAIASQHLWPAIQAGLVLPQNEVYQFYQKDEELSVGSETPLAISYQFLHDRVQQAAYTLIPEAQRQKTHLQIGRLLLRQTSIEAREDKIFAIANQLNQGIALIVEPEEREALAKLNLQAGQKACSSTAYAAATRYFQTGIDLLPANSWESQYQLALALHEAAAEAEYLSGNLDSAAAFIDLVLQNAQTQLDRVNIYELQIQLYMAQNQSVKAIEMGLDVLETLGVQLAEVPDAPGWGVSLPDLDAAGDLPEMADAEQQAALRLLIGIASPAYNAKPEMLPALTLTQVKLCQESGYSARAAFSFVFYGLLMCAMTGEIETGYRAGQVALKLLDQFDAKTLQCKVFDLFNAFIRIWKEPLAATIAPLLEGLQSGLATGDLEYVGYSAIGYCLYLFAIGEPLDTVERQQSQYLDLMVQVKQDYPIQFIKIAKQLTLNLAGKADNPCLLVGSSFDETEALPSLLASNNQTLLCFFYTCKTLLFYLFGEREQALESATQAAGYSVAAVGFGLFFLQNFYHSLALLANCDRVESEERQQFLERVEANQKQMKNWSNHAPANYLHRYYLVEAERYRVQGERSEALEMYDLAIATARENGYIQDEALAGERAAQFYFEWGKAKIAKVYLSDAYYGYASWGSLAKGKDLEARYPQHLPSRSPQDLSDWSADSTILSTTSRTLSTAEETAILDLATVMKAAQALSGEIHLDRLLSKLMEVAIENAGADMGALMLYDGECLAIEAQASFGEEETASESLQITCGQAVPLQSSQTIPKTLVNYVERAEQTLVLEDATAATQFAGDPVIEARQPKSVLCTPIRDRGHVAGILYLENKSLARAFTSDRVELLQLLASQAAVALENARLYRKLETYSQNLEAKVDERTKELQAEIIERRQIEAALGERLQLAALSADIWSALSHRDTLEEILRDCTIALVAHNDAAFARIWTFDEATDELVLQASAGLYTHTDGAHSRIPVGRFKIGKIAQECQPHLTNDVLNDPRVSDKEWALREGMVAFAGYPLVLGSRLIGVMALFARHPLTEVTLRQMEEVATEIALAIDRKRSELALRRSESQLREQTQQLQRALETVQKTQAQLIQTEKMSGLGQMVAGVAHEINNPINFIYGNVMHAENYIQDLFDLIDTYDRETPNPTPTVCDCREDIDLDFLREDLPKLMNSMKVGSDRIRSIILSLRNFSRLDEAEMKPADLHEGIENTLLILQHRFKARSDRPGIALLKNYGQLPPVTCYPSHLNQVFMNILNNAIDAIEDSTKRKQQKGSESPSAPTIRIQTQIIPNPQTDSLSATEAERWVAIRIADSGLGIKKVLLPKIFDPFFTTKSVGSGTGLGLSVSYQIVTDQHGGRLRCVSEPGQGAEFIIQLPLSPSSTSKMPSPQHSSS